MAFGLDRTKKQIKPLDIAAGGIMRHFEDFDVDFDHYEIGQKGKQQMLVGSRRYKNEWIMEHQQWLLPS